MPGKKRGSGRRRRAPRRRSPAPGLEIEAEIPPGLESVARAEIAGRLGRALTWRREAGEGRVRFGYHGDPTHLFALGTVLSIYRVERLPVPRPRALLGDEHFRALLGWIEAVRALHPEGRFTTFRLGAAGAESSVMRRLATEIGTATGLEESDPAELLLRLRRPERGEGWEILIRLTPRPLATREWRVCDLEGALNGAVARAMALLSEPTQADRLLNLVCGSGSLLIERLALGPAARALGVDHDPAALRCARANLRAAGVEGQIELRGWDATAIPLPAASFDVLLADLPFGHRVGSHAENMTLYPALLAEGARLARVGALWVVISHEVRLLEGLLASSRSWRLRRSERVTLRGLHPRIYVLERVRS